MCVRFNWVLVPACVIVALAGCAWHRPSCEEREARALEPRFSIRAKESESRRIAGQLTMRRSGRPLRDGSVRLLDTLLRPITGALSDSTGAFAFDAPRAGTFVLRVMRVGYVRGQRRVEVKRGHGLQIEASLHEETRNFAPSQCACERSRVCL